MTLCAYQLILLLIIYTNSFVNSYLFQVTCFHTTSTFEFMGLPSYCMIYEFT